MKQKAFTLGFTLAEIMIALVVIGVITSILLPVAFNSVPDENVMKFKKGNATLAKVINELASSEQFYLAGDLGKDKNGNWVEKPDYFCITFSEILNTKSVYCKDKVVDSSYPPVGVDGDKNNYWKIHYQIEKTTTYLDYLCKTLQNEDLSKIVTNDDITYFEALPNFAFGADKPIEGKRNVYYYTWDYTTTENFETGEGNTSQSYGTDQGFLYTYKPFCMDIDGIGEGEDPFGYGIRVDGKILLGERAQEWLSKNIQDKD